MSKASKATVKVGGKKVKVEKKEKVEKPAFDLKKALDENGNPIALSEGRLTALPANVKNEKLKRNQFSTRTLYAEYQRQLLIEQRIKLDKRIEDKELEIKELKSGGDPKLKKVRRVKKLQEQMAALMKALKDDGLDPAEYGLEG